MTNIYIAATCTGYICWLPKPVSIVEACTSLASSLSSASSPFLLRATRMQHITQQTSKRQIKKAERKRTMSKGVDHAEEETLASAGTVTG